MEECIELFEIDVEHHLDNIQRWDDLVTPYWEKKGRTRPDHMRTTTSAYDPSADYDDGR